MSKFAKAVLTEVAPHLITNDPPPPIVSVWNADHAKEGESLSWTFKRTGDLSEPLTVYYHLTSYWTPTDQYPSASPEDFNDPNAGVITFEAVFQWRPKSTTAYHLLPPG